MNVRPKARERFFFRDGHASNRVVLLENEYLQAGPRQITRAGQAIVSCADDDGVKRMWHDRGSFSQMIFRLISARDKYEPTRVSVSPFLHPQSERVQSNRTASYCLHGVDARAVESFVSCGPARGWP